MKTEAQLSEARQETAAPVDFETAWQAVQERDATRDGRFVFAVVTTGVYCRPSCPARRPLRRNVRFFAQPDGAEAAGFRACLRCRPREEATDARRVLAEAARDFLEQHLDETVTLSQLAEQVGASPWHLQRSFSQHFGLSPRAYVNARRVERVKELLRSEEDVTTAVYEAGFGSASQLYAQSDRQLGMTPGQWSKGAEGLPVRHVIVSSPLGRLLVAATERGVCSVRLGDNDEALRDELTRELPAAQLVAGDEVLQGWVDEIVRRVSGAAPATSVPLDLAGSDFQRRVWQALQEIPRGSTRSYSEVAREIGRPTAARAVARACATNRVAVLVPCHRVVPANGGTGGYRWGEERKQELLASEASANPAAED